MVASIILVVLRTGVVPRVVRVAVDDLPLTVLAPVDVGGAERHRLYGATGDRAVEALRNVRAGPPDYGTGVKPTGSRTVGNLSTSLGPIEVA